MFDLMHSNDLMVWVKSSDIEINQISIFDWIYDLMGLGYDLSNSILPKKDIGSGELGFIFCGKHPLHVIGIQLSAAGPKGPLVEFT